MISFVCWKWRGPDGRRFFLSEHVNVLRAMIARHYSKPFRFVCITDDAKGLDPKIEALPIPAAAIHESALRNPRGDRFPECYRRLWNFSREATILGERIFQLDIDVIVCGDLAPLIERNGDFVGWSDPRFETHKIAGGAYLLRTGSLTEIWDRFDPATSPARAFKAGFLGSDQGWISYKLGARPHASVGFWREAGLLKINWTQAHARTPPRGGKMIFTTGVKPPWARETQRKYPWVRDYWKF